MQFNTDAGHDEWMAAVKDQLETNLGLKVNMTSVPFADMLDNEQQPAADRPVPRRVGCRLPDAGELPDAAPVHRGHRCQERERADHR